MDAQEVKSLLNARAVEVCEHLLPAGKVDGGDYKVGDLHNAPGQSLVICIRGAKVGVWKDFSTDEKGGNLLELWVQAKGLEFKEAIREAKAWLGVSDAPLQRHRPVEPKRRDTTGLKTLECPEVVEGSLVWKWLTEKRGLEPKTIRAYRLGEERFALKRLGPDPINWVIFPFYDGEGNLVRIKYRDIANKRNTFQKPSMKDAEEYAFGAPKLLFGQQAIPKTTGMIGLTEGELDAMSMYQAAVLPSVSLPEGAQVVQEGRESPHDQWIEHDHDWLEQFTDIVLALDADEPGRKAQEQILPRLGYARCREILWPDGVKDANEAMQAGEPLADLVRDSRDFTPEELRKPSDFAKDIWDEFYPENSDRPAGDKLPWNLPFEFRAGELIIWHGYNGHGKTMLMNHCLIHVASQTKRACIASLEIPARKTFRNMARQAIARIRPEEEWQMWRVLDWMDRHFIVYDKVGETDSTQLLEAFEYAYRKWGLQHYVVDSLMMLGDIEQDDYVAQTDALKAFKAFAHKHSVTVHVVCHSKKPTEKRPAEKKCPLKYDISGSSNMPNVADSIIAAWRNQHKEACKRQYDYLMKQGQFEEAEKVLKPVENQGDALFQVQKQRETGEEPGKFLWFDTASCQFVDKAGDSPLIYVDIDGERP